jgi:gas vesicle protein
MAYEYDRFEREDGGGSFLMGLLAGTVLGAGLGMLFAPKTGSEIRTQLGEQAGRLRSSANETYQQASEKVSQIMDRGREAYERARGAAGQPGSDLGSTGGGTFGGTTSGGYGSGTSGTGNTGVGTGNFTGAGTNRG